MCVQKLTSDQFVALNQKAYRAMMKTKKTKRQRWSEETVQLYSQWSLTLQGTNTDPSATRLGVTGFALSCIRRLYFPSFFYRRMPFVPHNQQHQSTEGQRTK